MFAALFLACLICFQYSLISQTVTYHSWVTPLLVTHKSRKLFCVSGCNCSEIPQWTGWECCQSQPKLYCQNKIRIDCQNLFKICLAYLQQGFFVPLISLPTPPHFFPKQILKPPASFFISLSSWTITDIPARGNAPITNWTQTSKWQMPAITS